MHQTLIRRARQVVGSIGIALVFVVVAFSLFTHLAPLAGTQLFIVGGGSMEPSIPIGSLAITNPVDLAGIAVGDVVTIRAQHEVVVTHRVVRVVAGADGPLFELKGDANGSADASLVSGTAIVGRTDLYLPFAGYVQSFLSTSTGLVTTLAMFGVMLLAYLLLESFGRNDVARPVPAATPKPTRDAVVR